MPLVPGTYLIHDTDSGRILTYYSAQPFGNKMGTWKNNRAESQKASSYAYIFIPYLTSCTVGVDKKTYMAIGADGRDACGMEEDDAAILELQQSNDSYFIKVIGTQSYLEHPNTLSTLTQGLGHMIVNFTTTLIDTKCSWRFEKIGDDAGSALKPRPGTSIPVPSTPQPSILLPPNSGSLYTDDAHFYTDMLFNMPRTPFTRTQRIAALDWARKLGATNVPTMESFD
ncbi:unnamed protein product [Rhizoctonia solani]|nr:unnamed protein product [Rhizoctonia solani]